MKITTVYADSPGEFDRRVNALLSAGWEFHGQPLTQALAKQSTSFYSHDLVCHTELVLVQVLKKNDPVPPSE